MMDHLLRAFPAKGYDAAAGEGLWLTGSDGRRFMDLGGASHGTALIGHNHPAVVSAIQQAAGRLLHVNGNVPNPDRTAFLRRLHDILPAHLTQTFLSNSGAEAVECAIKLALTTGRDEIIAIDGGFHGRTMGALSVTSKAAYREPFAARLASTRFIRPDDIDGLRDAIGPRTAAVIAEPILGEGGVHPLSPGFLQAIRDETRTAGALFIADEVQTSFRTGPALASAGHEPDIVVLGKGLAGGLPIGATCVTQAVAEALPPGGHGSTYGGAPIVAAAGDSALAVWQDLPAGRAKAIEAEFRRQLTHPAIAEVRGVGAMLALRLHVRAPPVMTALEQEGVLVLPAGPRDLRLLPPLTISDGEIAEACRRIHAVLGAVTS